MKPTNVHLLNSYDEVYSPHRQYGQYIYYDVHECCYNM